MIHSDSPFCEIVSRKNYFTTEIVTMDFLLVQLHFTIRQDEKSQVNLEYREDGQSANDNFALTFYCSSLNNSAIIDNITVRRVYWFELKIDCVGRRMKGVIAW